MMFALFYVLCLLNGCVMIQCSQSSVNNDSANSFIHPDEIQPLDYQSDRMIEIETLEEEWMSLSVKAAQKSDLISTIMFLDPLETRLSIKQFSSDIWKQVYYFMLIL
jgi:hypothetical protein